MRKDYELMTAQLEALTKQENYARMQAEVRSIAYHRNVHLDKFGTIFRRPTNSTPSRTFSKSPLLDKIV